MCAENIAQTSPKDKVWNVHKAENSAVGRLYGDNPRYSKYSQRMGGCADWLEFAELRDHDRKLKLTRATFCHVRHCPICQWRKMLARIARFMSNLETCLGGILGYAYIFVTLTTRNCDFDELRATIRAQNAGVQKLLKRLGRMGVAVHGYIRVNEVTKGKDGLAHPHIHLILAVSPSYFSGHYYVPQKKLAELWGACMRLDYTPVVNVKRVRMSDKKKAKFRAENGREPTYADEVTSGIVEVSKYSVKPEEIAEDADYLYAVTEQCHKLRFLGTGGCLKDVFKAGTRDAEDISDEEMLLPGEEDSEEKVSPWRQLYLWNRARGYELRLRRKAARDRLVDGLQFREGLTDALRQRAREERQRKTPPRSAGDSAGARVSA